MPPIGSARTARANSMPLMFGMFQSVMTNPMLRVELVERFLPIARFDRIGVSDALRAH